MFKFSRAHSSLPALKKILAICGTATLIVLIGWFVMSTVGVTRTDQPEDVAARLESRIGQTVTYSGYARDTKGGAVLSIEGIVRFHVYLQGISSWPPEYLDRKVSVTGRFAHKKYLPDPRLRDGVVSQGAEGLQYVFENPEWRLAY